SKLFSPFERLHLKEDFEGIGLGLSIVRNIIQRHGGRVWVESEPGIRTIIYFSLPVK
ncbi:MAG: hybrid sensor histidine kinase/response regulator, partial [Clostridiales bacterium]|nr:hybrid sensor histidine kinase/response regulator [Clostridiales bacterium]